MRNISLVLICFVLVFGGACHASYYKVKMVKPKSHWGWFDQKKDAKKKRVKTVKYKSLKRTKGISADSK